jgi:hypothetical protein
MPCIIYQLCTPIRIDREIVKRHGATCGATGAVDLHTVSHQVCKGLVRVVAKWHRADQLIAAQIQWAWSTLGPAGLAVALAKALRAPAQMAPPT